MAMLNNQRVSFKKETDAPCIGQTDAPNSCKGACAQPSSLQQAPASHGKSGHLGDP